ncbi:NADH:flavin oxidoreductase/NADH oxidase [Marinomonas ostreistagni]|uniref:NADH:flavin oxidoreductase/NADH oxidase n=1 Tax=Marinomonas ostreistagni TaxID=359209 RepID=UPI00194E434A|nr:NADH:flavin oxidoreductase/NADH oxidase [Marinomonas ostreistagni]MBM6550866.1 NADH:flavin oxidoreductase/NADH oxidase [Marinomonas ostreistagni]
MAELFTPFTLKSITLKNRIGIPPMCQYSAGEDGVVNNWHKQHYAELARGGAGLVVVEATAVSPEGRISPNDVGIWNDQQADELAKIATSIKENGSVPGIQIAHAGRKASANRPWDGDDHLAEDDPRGWDTIAPSAVAFGANLPKTPKEMSHADIERVQQNFVDAAKRALDAGFEWLELHFAHGYLAQSFFNRDANQRTDEYGGDKEGRGKFLIDTLKAVRAVWPQELPLTARFGVIEYDGRDEETLEESIWLIKEFKDHGLDFLSVSFGFSTPDVNIPWGPSMLAQTAERVRRETGLPVASAWGFDKPQDAERAIAEQQLDQVLIGRAYLANPRYTYQLAKALEVENPSWVLPAPYAHWAGRY